MMDKVQVIMSMLPFNNNTYWLHGNTGTFEEVAALYNNIAVHNVIKMEGCITAIQTGNSNDLYQR
jgi:hypothetical protein